MFKKISYIDVLNFDEKSEFIFKKTIIYDYCPREGWKATDVVWEKKSLEDFLLELKQKYEKEAYIKTDLIISIEPIYITIITKTEYRKTQIKDVEQPNNECKKDIKKVKYIVVNYSGIKYLVSGQPKDFLKSIDEEFEEFE